MITEAHGNLLRADVDALVNTVNTAGIMGKGIALQFKRAYPDMFKEYSRAAKRGDLQLGQMHVWPTGLMTGPRYIINFPTKAHWRSNSKMLDIEASLADLVRVVRELEITSIALPPLDAATAAWIGRRLNPSYARSWPSYRSWTSTCSLLKVHPRQPT